MYRTLLSIFICVSAVQTAPQEANSQTTNVKPASLTDTLNSSRESPIESIPPILHIDNRSEEDNTRHNDTSERDSKRNSQDDNRNRSEESTKNKENVKRNPIVHLDSRSEEDDTSQASKSKGKSTRNTEDSENINSSQEWKRNEENKRTIRSDVTTVNYESETTAVTERDDDIHDIVDETVDYESRTKPPPSPRFISKLSYFQKNDYSNPVLTNLVERPGRKRFTSKCRCEKIWNCPKLQITVPRCPNEYFLCCF